MVPTIWKVKKHFDIGQNVSRNNAKLKCGHSIPVNPNSYISVKRVLGTLHDDLNIGTEHEYGPPYLLASRIIDEDPETYGWALMENGLCHEHMNQLKAYFRVADDIFLHALGIINFISKNAYSFFVNAKDTHKSFQTLEILLHGTACEICRMYSQGINQYLLMGF